MAIEPGQRTIEEAKRLQVALEQGIRSAIESFEQSTGLRVVEVNVGAFGQAYTTGVGWVRVRTQADRVEVRL